MKFVSYCNKIIEYSFYLLFFLVPLVFLGNTSELFEFNKMWLTFVLTIIIAVCWISKMIIGRQIVVRRTPLDIPLVLFLLSQIISTIFSLDTHVSLWGYYSRFNGGLFSMISYIFLYYAFVSNLEVKHVIRVMQVTLVSGLITALWGFPSHFGYDPTCFVFRGSLDTECWTDAFKPTIRVFSTLGQPAWFAAYLGILLPITTSYFIIHATQKRRKLMSIYFVLALLFYICLIFANTRAGTMAFIVADIIFWIVLFSKRIFSKKVLLKYLLILHISFAICSFFFGAPISSLNKFTLPQLRKSFIVSAETRKSGATVQDVVKTSSNIITDSSQIRLLVWRGAIEAWLANPIFGTGVETFAYAYYRYRPTEHNLTSEWDYLYNKAHNEYLNFLTTTGAFGLGTYVLIIFVFLFVVVKYFFVYKNQASDKNLHLAINTQFLLIGALFCSFLTILITNFFGFSVVIINLYFFLIPAFVFLIMGRLSPDVKFAIKKPVNVYQWGLIIIALIAAGNMILGLFRYWYADTVYALGYNLDHASAYQQAFPLLLDAVTTVPDEPIYQDELAVNLATISQALYSQKDTTTAGQFAMKAVNLDNQVVENHPNNVVFWKDRLRIFYSLANSDAQNRDKYIQESLHSLAKSRELAPTDAKLAYNMGVLLGQEGRLLDGAGALEEAVKFRPNYYDAYSALGLLYHQLALDQTIPFSASSSADEKILHPEWQKKAIDTYQYILDNLSSNNEQVKKTMEEWKHEASPQ